MLPNIAVNDRNKRGTLLLDVGLVWSDMNLEFMLRTIVDEPAPTRAFDSDSFSVEYLQHVVDVTVLSLDSIEEWAWGGPLAVRWWAHGFPEDFVVQMTTSVKADLTWDLIQSFEILPLKGFLLLVKQGIEVVDISAMMFSIMEFKCLTAHHGL